MESSVYSQDGNVNLYFIRQSASSEDACATALLCAYQACDENGLNPEWMSSEDCLKMAPSKQDVFVIDPFEGDAFKHLTNGFKCVVLGPRCILSCLHRKESIPELPSPIHNTAMKGLVLTSTGFEKEERAELQLLVERMAGIYSNNFHQGVTHMIANVVGSKKYLVAVEQEVPILTEEWVQAVWRAASGQGKDQQWGEDVKATDERFLSFSCPVFKGLVICVSQMDRSTKAALKNIIDENGGSYSTSLDMTSTSVLIIPSPEGEKYNHAVNWRIQCLTPDWIYDSVEQGFALKMDGYVVTKRNTSTPSHDTTANVPQPDFSMCSTIMNDTGLPKATHVDETALDMSVLKKKDTDSAEVTRGLESLESLDLQEVMHAGLFLDGCKIFLSGFSAVHLEKLRRVLNAGGATRFNQLSEAVSHVVLGKKVEEHLSTIKSWSSQPHVVYADWITESVRQKRPADELPFTHSIDSDNFKSPSHTNVKVPKRNNANNSLGNDETHVDEEVLSHYLKHQKLDGSNSTSMNESVNTSSFPSSQARNTAQVFQGKIFTVSGYSEENLKSLVHVIEENGGMVLPKDHQGHVDFALSGSVEEACLSAQEMVSYYYIEDCTEQNKLLPVKYYHMPLQLPGDVYPLGDCTIAISVYAGKERVFLETLTTLLGGMYQEVFAKKSNPSKDIQGSTHLICPEASEGGKYRAAVKWGVPVVTGDWLLACAHTGLRLPEEQFAVNASTSHSLDRKAILRELYEKTVRSHNALSEPLPWEETEEVEVAPTPINKKVKALRNQSFCSPSDIKTPDSESFRKLYPTPGTSAKPDEESLSEMKTPETPYGSTWYPSPSPRTRKRFKRMIDAIPDPPQDLKPLPAPLQAYNKMFVSEGQEFLKNYKIRKTPVYLRKDKKTGQEVELREEKEAVAADCHGPLTGVVICTSHKLQEQQKELYKAVTALGGDYRWVYDPSVTHFVFQGRENDLSKDFRQARDDGKLIVAPDWIWMCQDENSRIDEHLFPHTHNPKLTLSLVGGKSSPVKRKNRLVRKNKSVVAQEIEENQTEEQNSGSIHKKKEEKNSSKDEDEEERAKISKQLEEIDALASNSITSGRRSGGVGRNLSLTDRMRHTPTKPIPVDTQSVAVEVPESQTTAITWEDPQEREARLHLQHQLTKDTQEIINDNHKLLSKEMENENRENDDKENKSLKEPGMTTDGSHNRKDSSKTLVFMLLGMNEERSHYTKLVEDLGGVVSQADYFDPSTTHVITPRPSRSERNLGSIASGKWFLHDSYLEESSHLGYFVQEESYAWGNPEATSLPKLQPGSTEAQLATAAWRWRQIIYRGVTNDSVGTVRGAFQSMTALICSSAERIGAFTRLIKAGGGKVVKARPPFSDVKDITHFFWEPNKTSEKVDLANFASRQIPCLNPVYLSHYLIQEAAPNETEHYVPEYRDIITNMSTPNHSMIKRKRK